MKNIFFLMALAAAPWCGWGQTRQIEEAILNAQLKDGSLTGPVALTKSRAWQAVRGGYPDIPWDTVSKKVVVERVIEFAGVMKGQAFKRVKEWAALRFGKLDDVLEYEDAESGKIIVEGWVPVYYEATFASLFDSERKAAAWRELEFSLVVTLKDGRAKVRYENLAYRYNIGGFSFGGVYMPSQVFRLPLDCSFPVIANDSSTWKGTLDLLSKTMVLLTATAPDLEGYIRAVLDDYRF